MIISRITAAFSYLAKKWYNVDTQTILEGVIMGKEKPDMIGVKFKAYNNDGISIVVREIKDGIYECKVMDKDITFIESASWIMQGEANLQTDEVCEACGFKTYEQLSGGDHG